MKKISVKSVSKLSKRTAIIAGLSLVVVIAAAAVAWQLSSSNDKNITGTTTTGTTTSQKDGTGNKPVSDGDKPANSQSTGTTNKNVTDQPAAPAGSQTASTGSSITIDGHAFSPATLTVKKGTAITWTNKDSATHAIDMADDTDGPHSPQLTTGQSYTYSFSKAGTYNYICVLHPDMHATIIVTD